MWVISRRSNIGKSRVKSRRASDGRRTWRRLTKLPSTSTPIALANAQHQTGDFGEILESSLQRRHEEVLGRQPCFS
jgi:hypothetical protein